MRFYSLQDILIIGDSARKDIPLMNHFGFMIKSIASYYAILEKGCIEFEVGDVLPYLNITVNENGLKEYRIVDDLTVIGRDSVYVICQDKEGGIWSCNPSQFLFSGTLLGNGSYYITNRPLNATWRDKEGYDRLCVDTQHLVIKNLPSWGED